MIGARCVLCTRRPPRMTEGRRRACDLCATALYQQLVRIGDLTGDLRLLLPPSRLGVAVPIAQPRNDAPPAPLRVDVLALLTDTGDLSITGVLGGWAQHVATDRRMTTPDDPGAFLRKHVDWITEQPYLEELAADIRRIETAAARVCQEAAYRAATCRRVIDGRDCGGAIVATAEDETATCNRCGTVWHRSQWREMGATA